MNQLYRSNGVRFRYPDDWELNEEQSIENEVSITVSSSETSFWSLTLFLDGELPEVLVESAIEAFREEYEELDIYTAEADYCHRTNIARDVEFVCFELMNSAFLRAFRSGSFSVLILYQGNDQELEETKSILEEISASLECASDEAIFS